MVRAGMYSLSKHTLLKHEMACWIVQFDLVFLGYQAHASKMNYTNYSNTTKNLHKLDNELGWCNFEQSSKLQK